MKSNRKPIIKIVALVLVLSLISVELMQYVITAVSAGKEYMNITRQAADNSLQKGISMIQEGDYKEALKSFSDALSLYGADASATMLMQTASLYSINGDDDSALVLLHRAAKDKDSASEANLMISEIYLDRKDYENALKYAKTCLEYDKENARAYVVAASSESFLGNEDAAIDILKESMPYADELPEIRGILANTYFERGEYLEAAEIFKQIMSADDTDLDAMYNLAICYVNLQETDEAMKLFEDLEKKDYNLISVKTILAEIYMSDDKLKEKALSEYDDIIRIAETKDEMYGQAMSKACELAAKLEKHEDCIRYANENLSSSGKNEEVYLFRAISYLQLGRLKESLTDLNRVLALGDNDYAYYCRALTYIGLEDYEAAGNDLLLCMKLTEGKNEELYNNCEELLKQLTSS